MIAVYKYPEQGVKEISARNKKSWKGLAAKLESAQTFTSW